MYITPRTLVAEKFIHSFSVTAISVCSTRSVEGTTFHFKISLQIKLVLFLVFLIFLSFPLHLPVSIRVCLMCAIRRLWLLLWISRVLSIHNFLLPDQWTSRNGKLYDVILFQSTNTHKLSSIFSAPVGVYKVAFKRFIRTRSVWVYLKLARAFDLFRRSSLN